MVPRDRYFSDAGSIPAASTNLNDEEGRLPIEPVRGILTGSIVPAYSRESLTIRPPMKIRRSGSERLCMANSNFPLENQRLGWLAPDGDLPYASLMKGVDLQEFGWQVHCRGLFEPPMAA